MSGTVLGAEDATGKRQSQPSRGPHSGGKADNKYISKLVKVISGAGKCDGG